MELNSKKLERTSRIVYYSISVLLSIFLILLSSKIIDDLDRTVSRPQLEDYLDNAKLSQLNATSDSMNLEISNLNSKRETINRAIEAAQGNYQNEKSSFDAWIVTRKTLGSPDKDTEVLERVKQIDSYLAIEKDWRAKDMLIQGDIDLINKKLGENQELIYEAQNEAQKVYDTVIKAYDLKVFLIRLLFVAPILALGIFFFVRFRRHKFWPLYFGFTLFSLYAFFVGLVPYLPSYGGYVRSTVGVILSIGLGYYAIKSIRVFIEKKQEELKISTQERAKNVRTEVAEKALENHHCPSCGKDFIVRRWEFAQAKATFNPESVYMLATNYCRHCGLELFKNCSNCGAKNYAHLPYCSDCGTSIR